MPLCRKTKRPLILNYDSFWTTSGMSIQRYWMGWPQELLLLSNPALAASYVSIPLWYQKKIPELSWPLLGSCWSRNNRPSYYRKFLVLSNDASIYRTQITQVFILKYAMLFFFFWWNENLRILQHNIQKQSNYSNQSFSLAVTESVIRNRLRLS